MNNPVTPLAAKVSDLGHGFFYMLPNIGIAVLVFGLFILAAWGAQRGIAGVLRTQGRTDLGVLLGGFAKWALLLLGGLVAATIIFPSIKPADLFSALGVGSVAIGFAFKDILQNWLSGLLILYRQPFRRGDEIRSGDFEGVVELIEARATLLRTYDGQRVVVPNSDIYTRAMTVRTAYPKLRSEHDVSLPHEADVEQACAVICRTLGTLDGPEREPPPEAIPWELAGSTVNIRVRWWSSSQRASVVHARGQVIAAISRALTGAGIGQPSPANAVLPRDQASAPSAASARQEAAPAHASSPAARDR